MVPNPFILIRREKLLKPLKWSTPTPACLAFAFVPVAAGSSIERLGLDLGMKKGLGLDLDMEGMLVLE